MRLDLLWSLAIISESEPMLCGIPLSEPDYFVGGGVRLRKFSILKGFFLGY